MGGFEWDNELYHHGIKGQRWGVRRYQNADGSLTPLGEKRYYEILKNSNLNTGRKEAVEKQKAIAGVKTVGRVEVVSKGSTFQRIADVGEGIDSRRKYVSLLKDDNDRYKSMSSLLNTKNKGLEKVYNYEATKDIKIADEKKVLDYIIKEYGDETLKEASDFISKYNNIDSILSPFNKHYNSLRKKDKKMLLKIRETYLKNLNTVDSVIGKILASNEKSASETFSHFKKMGYDAIIDVQDKLAFSDFPLILLDPKSSIKFK